jgi:hypothetical protein
MLRLLFCDGLMSFATGSSQQQVRPRPLCRGGLNLSQSRVARNCSGQLLVALEHVYEVPRSDEPSECQSAFKFGSDSLLMQFEGRLAF